MDDGVRDLGEAFEEEFQDLGHYILDFLDGVDDVRTFATAVRQADRDTAIAATMYQEDYFNDQWRGLSARLTLLADDYRERLHPAERIAFDYVRDRAAHMLSLDKTY